MSQPLARLFDKWLDAGGDLTFSEWLTEKRERAQAMRRPGAVIQVTRAQLDAIRQQQLAAYRQQSIGTQQMLARGLLRGNLFSGILG